MYPTSTQKKCWTFSSKEELQKQRDEANEGCKERYRRVLESDEQESQFLTPAEEELLCKIVAEAGVKFGDDFQPTMWPSVRWTAFAYFKRFYLRHSAMEYSPKTIVMASYYLAAKVDEFNVTIDEFIKNLRQGTPQSNADMVLRLEPILMLELNYQLTVHAPFRPFEGHMMDMKTKMMLGFDLEQIRPHSTDFFKKALVSDVMLLFPPSQIALAALKYGLDKLGHPSTLFREYLLKLFEVDTWRCKTEDMLMIEKLELKVADILKIVESESAPVDAAKRPSYK
ncbi:cyclin domain-containing protein [Aphelenchoides avenae]|nr:cyclin domain-containing protein [Aphelenchus avenae]